MKDILESIKSNIRWQWNSFRYTYGFTDLNPLQHEMILVLKKTWILK